MASHSIQAYETAARVAAYDADMDLMHPNRHPMAAVILDVLAASATPPSLIVDLGTGTGFLLQRLLTRFPHCRAVAVDGSAEMAAMAQSRLGELADRVRFVVADFRAPAAFAVEPGTADAVVSAYALHHLNLPEKREALARCRELLRPGGWFLNADLIVAESAEMEHLTQQMRVAGIVARAAGADPRFQTAQQTRQFLDELERNECDQPLRESDDLEILTQAGFRHPTALWKHTREIVTAAMR